MVNAAHEVRHPLREPSELFRGFDTVERVPELARLRADEPVARALDDRGPRLGLADAVGLAGISEETTNAGVHSRVIRDARLGAWSATTASRRSIRYGRRRFHPPTPVDVGAFAAAAKLRAVAPITRSVRESDGYGMTGMASAAHRTIASPASTFSAAAIDVATSSRS